jgi:flagellar FliJ protein
MKDRNDDSGSLQTLAELKALEERTAAQRLRAARERLEGERVKLTTVQRFLVEYSAASNGATSPARLLVDRQRFRLELERSVEVQSSEVERAQSQAESARAHWAGVRAEREAMQKLVERREADAARRSLQAEQRLSDELAAGGAAKGDDAAMA